MHPEVCEGGKITETDYMSQYAQRLCDKIKKEVNADDYDHPLKGFKIAVDAATAQADFMPTRC